MFRLISRLQLSFHSQLAKGYEDPASPRANGSSRLSSPCCVGLFVQCSISGSRRSIADKGGINSGVEWESHANS